MPQNTFGVNTSLTTAIQETLTATTSTTSAPAACFWQATLAT